MALWRQLLTRSGNSENYERGIRLFDQGHYEDAITAFKATLAEPKISGLIQRLSLFYLAEAHSQLAQSQLSQGSGGNAIVNLEAAIELNPRYADLQYNLGAAYLGENDLTRAAEGFERAIEINPKFARANLMLGIVLYQLGDRERALYHIRQAVYFEPTLKANLLTEATEADARGDSEAALTALKRLSESENDKALFHARLAQDLYRRSMYDEAIEEYNQALLLRPNYADLRNQLGVTLFAIGKVEEAEIEFARALEINPRYIEARINHALLLQRLGRNVEARQDYAIVLEADPGNTVALENLNILSGNG